MADFKVDSYTWENVEMLWYQSILEKIAHTKAVLSYFLPKCFAI